ncbi:NADH-quinone oxidoreductase subunit A [Salinispira pacifica]
MPVYVGLVLLLTAIIIFLSALIGERHKKSDSELPFESGITSTGSARIRFNVQFYIVAMLFLVFDMETIFIITWAVAAGTVGWPGYFEVAVFILLLLAALFYLIRVGAIDWRKRLSRHAGTRARINEPHTEVASKTGGNN